MSSHFLIIILSERMLLPVRTKYSNLLDEGRWHLTESRTRIRRSLRHPYPIKPRVLIVLYQLFSISRTHPSFEIATAFSINYRNDPISRVFRDAWLLWVRVSQSTASVNFFKVCEPFDVLFLTWELLYNFLGFLIF